MPSSGRLLTDPVQVPAVPQAVVWQVDPVAEVDKVLDQDLPDQVEALDVQNRFPEDKVTCVSSARGNIQLFN